LNIPTNEGNVGVGVGVFVGVGVGPEQL